ncbi:uncharacterized protein LOC131983342 isoform X2 [Centropristis striata]|uniref:uncharacterized protein LOC131983342 isoform X2 n=1 Tax=Centropristis striata TaxID=184440 RepID=UPI0027DFA1FD|nr:uncharacterized protein LOC131983342 isoform X2 [Centropristis striata]
MTSSHSELKNISAELNRLSLKKQQLLERKKMLSVILELGNRKVKFEQTEAADSYHRETESIDDQLKQLTERELELQKSRETILGASNKSSLKKVSIASTQETEPNNPNYNVFYVEPPPNVPAPTVILDVDNLPACPCRTQCPQCREFVMTETFTSVSSITWLVCFMTALVGCVAGCCLIPFCMEKFKSTTHRCPKCRTSIKKIKKL